MKPWIPATLALAASITLPWALAAKEYSKAPAEVIEWPLPWAKGVSLDYDGTSERITEVKGVGNRVVTTGVTRIRILGEDAQGFVQSWTTLDSDTRYEKVSDTGQLMLQELTASMGGIPLEVRLSTDGTYTGIANLDAVHKRFGVVAKPQFERILAMAASPWRKGCAPACRTCSTC